LADIDRQTFPREQIEHRQARNRRPSAS
jgi:hypothetical protein